MHNMNRPPDVRPLATEAESAYRRGFHHGLTLAADLASQALSLKRALRLLGRAERICGKLRSLDRHPGMPWLRDAILRRVHRSAAPKQPRELSPHLQDVEPFHPGDDA
jgi:hypothetical protein